MGNPNLWEVSRTKRTEKDIFVEIKSKKVKI